MHFEQQVSNNVFSRLRQSDVHGGRPAGGHGAGGRGVGAHHPRPPPGTAPRPRHRPLHLLAGWHERKKALAIFFDILKIFGDIADLQFMVYQTGLDLPTYTYLYTLQKLVDSHEKMK